MSVLVILLINNSTAVTALEAETINALQSLQEDWAMNFDAEAKAWSM